MKLETERRFRTIEAARVTGPASSTDNAAVRFDSTTGKLAQNSALIIADTTGSLSRSGNGGIPVQGTNTNDSAAAGYVGEVMESIIAAGSGVSMTTNTTATVTSLSLTAGDWDVFGYVQFTPGATTSVTDLAGGTDTGTSITVESFRLFSSAYVPNNNLRQSIPMRRYSLASTTTVNLLALAVFTVSTMVGSGRITARRAR